MIGRGEGGDGGADGGANGDGDGGGRPREDRCCRRVQWELGFGRGVFEEAKAWGIVGHGIPVIVGFRTE